MDYEFSSAGFVPSVVRSTAKRKKRQFLQTSHAIGLKTMFLFRSVCKNGTKRRPELRNVNPLGVALRPPVTAG